MSKLKIKKVNVLKVAFFMGTVYGVVFGGIIVLLAIFGVAIQGEPLGLLFAAIMPVVYAVCGFIGGLIMGGVYNIVSKWIGGIEVEVEEIKKFSE